MDCSLKDCQNGVCESNKGENCVDTPNDCGCINGYCNQNTKKCQYESCGNNKCDDNENYISCPNDCEKPKEVVIIDRDSNYPLILIHGHSMNSQEYTGFSLSTWNIFQKKLESDKLYYDKGVIYASDNINNFKKDEYVNLDKPISIRMTYYKNIIDENIIEIGDQDSVHINEYASRLAEVVKIVKYISGKNKVEIIAHSMGGLIARAYLKNFEGYKEVNKLITVGTPNHGIWKRDYAIPNLCDWNHPGPECDDMNHDSPFIKELNSGDETPFNIGYMAIIGECGTSLVLAPSDGVIRVESAKLDGANNVLIQCSSIFDFHYGDLFHTNLPNPSRVPEVYRLITDFLEE